MKNTKKNTRDEFTLFQDVMDTYRYPDGTLNKIAVFISTLALILLVAVGHFIIDGIKQINKIENVSASELTIDEIQEYITNSYLDAVSDYSGKSINQDVAKDKILKMLSEYIQSSNGFTSEQQAALNQILSEYVQSTTIYSDIEKNSSDITAMSNVIEKKFEENQQCISQLQQLLQNEINVNTNLDETHLKELNEQIEWLQNFATNRMAEDSSSLNSMINELRRTYENSLGAKDYVEGTTYNRGDYVIYNEKLYISTTDGNTTSPENASNWKLSDLDEIIDTLEQTTNEEMAKMYEELTQSLADQHQHFTDEISNTNEQFSNEINNTNEHFTEEINNTNQTLADGFSNVTQAMNTQALYFTNQINDVNQSISGQGENFTNQINSVNQSISNQGADFQEQIDAINDLLKDNTKWFEFGYNPTTGAYGYYVNGQFKPW